MGRTKNLKKNSKERKKCCMTDPHLQFDGFHPGCMDTYTSIGYDAIQIRGYGKKNIDIDVLWIWQLSNIIYILIYVIMIVCNLIIEKKCWRTFEIS